MASEHQDELFKEFSKKKTGLEKIADKITEKRKRLYITVPLENIVFTSIVVIMFVVAAFAFGVERGKRFLPAMEVSHVEVIPAQVTLAKEESPPPEPKEESYAIHAGSRLEIGANP